MFRSKQTPAGVATEVAGLSWEAELVLNERRSRLLAWRVASVALLLAVLMGFSMLAVLPLKQVVPYVVTVDKLTGESHIAGTVQDFVSSSALNDKHWIKNFVIARERYHFQLLQHDYDRVKALAGDAAWKAYSRLYEGANARDAVLADTVEMIPTVLSIAINGNGTATARYELRTRNLRTGGEPVLTRHVATLRYSYRPQQAGREFELVDNPLGFSVDGYQTDPEFISGAPVSEVRP